MPLKIDLRPGEKLSIGDVVVTMVKKSGQLACLVIEADKAVPIRRVAVDEPAKAGTMMPVPA